MQNIENFINEINGEFRQFVNGNYICIKTGEYFTKSELDKYIQKKIEEYNVVQFHENNEKVKCIYNIDTDQRIINKRSKKPKPNNVRIKVEYNGSGKLGFNLVYRQKLEVLRAMQLDKNEKLVFYVLRDYVQYPSNCIVINDSIPSFKELEPIVSLTERTIRDALKSLESKNIIKLVQSGHKKAIYINPEYYASGKELYMETLEMFNLLADD